MSLGTTMSSQPVSIQLDNPNMASIAKRQRFQDVLFHRITQSFSLLVLIAALIWVPHPSQWAWLAAVSAAVASPEPEPETQAPAPTTVTEVMTPNAQTVTDPSQAAGQGSR